MHHKAIDEWETGRYWNANAEAWTLLSRAGHDIYRDLMNTPAFFAHLPPIQGLNGIDIGCGEGHNTRLLADQRALMSGIDIAPVFIDHARAMEKEFPLGIQYEVASATRLPYADAQFDFATSFMCLMDLPEPEKAIAEAYRVLKPGGFFQFSLEHPCFKTPHMRKLRNDKGDARAFEVGGYFSGSEGLVGEWIFGDAPESMRNRFPAFRVPVFHRTLEFWINTLIQAGFSIEHIHEPCPSPQALQQKPAMQGATVVAYFLQVRVRKG